MLRAHTQVLGGLAARLATSCMACGLASGGNGMLIWPSSASGEEITDAAPLRDVAVLE